MGIFLKTGRGRHEMAREDTCSIHKVINASELGCANKSYDKYFMAGLYKD